MNLQTKLVDVNTDNLRDYPQAICFINAKHKTWHNKADWLAAQFKHGLKIKLLFLEGVKRPFGFIEYVPGEHCWRPVSAKGYMFIHCLWTNGRKFQRQGLGGMLIDEAVRDAKGMLGVAAVTSSKAFMADRRVFEKSGFKLTREMGTEQLMVKQLKKGPKPEFNDWEKELAKQKGLTMVYSKQCPWVARFIEDVQPVLKQSKLKPKIIELKTAKQAQKAPSPYGSFNLIYNGKLLSDRYISITRLKNIVKKEMAK